MRSCTSRLATWWSLPEPDRTPAAAAGIVRERWTPLGFRDDAQADDWRERAAEMVERYVARLDPADEPVGVERTVALKTDRLAVSGRIDRLDRRGDELVVVDYKTGRHVLSTDDARGSLALAIYAMAAARTMRRAVRQGRAAPPADRRRRRVAAHRGDAGATPRSRGGDRGGSGGRAGARRRRARAARRGVPASARLDVRLVRLSRPLPGGPGGGAAADHAVGRSAERHRLDVDEYLD